MDKMKFSEDDKKKFVEFLNFIAKHARFDMDTNELIGYFSVLSHMQQSILPKIDANILEVVKIVEEEKKPKKGKKK